MKILVTGGAGFIGSHLTEALLSAGNSVHILDNLSTGKAENIPGNAVFHHADITHPSTVDLYATERFEVIFHLAAQLDVRKSVADPAFDAETNIVATLRMLETARTHGLQQFIFASSGGTVYGEQDYYPADEGHMIRPVSPYGISKATVEQYLRFYQLTYGLRYVALRYGNVYGPRQNPHGEAGVISIFADKILKGTQPMINGDGLQTRDYVYVADVVDANLRALAYANSGCFNVGTGKETDVIQLFDLVNAYFGNRFTRQFGPARAGEQRRSVLDFRLIHKEMGWKPHWTIAQALPQTLAWFEQDYARTHKG